MSGTARRASRGLGALVSAETVSPSRPEDTAPTTRPVAERETSSVPVTEPVSEPTTRASVPSEPKARSRKRGRRVGMERKYAGDIVRTTITLPTAVDDKLDELVFLQRKSTRRTKNDLMLEGIEALLTKYGAGTIDSLVRDASSE